MPREAVDSAPSLGVLYPKALLRALPQPGRGDTLPDRELELAGVEVSRDRLAEYDRVCGFRLRDELPATYPHLVAFPMSMKLMTARGFPFGPVGLVHIRNRIAQRRPLRLGETLTVRVRTDGLAPHDRGRAFDVRSEVLVDDEPVWESASTYLHREGGGGSGERRASPGASPEPRAVWRIPGDTGRRYAAVSGDRNPIHLRAITAKLFGFSRPIAHGMWLKARCLAALEGRLPEAFTVDVRFRSPVRLPSNVAWFEDGDEFALRQARGERTHLTGTIERA